MDKKYVEYDKKTTIKQGKQKSTVSSMYQLLLIIDYSVCIWPVDGDGLDLHLLLGTYPTPA